MMKKGGFSVAFLMLLILFNPKFYSCEAANFLVESNSSSFHCNGRLDECLISEEIELEFLMDSHVIRALDGIPAGGTSGSDISDQHYADCPAGYSYNAANGKCCRDLYKPETCK